MKIATLFSTAVFIGIVLFCIWLIPDWFRLHLFGSGYDHSAVLPALWVVHRLIRSRFRFSLRSLFIAVSAVSFFLGSWVLTREIGIPAVVADVDAQLTGPFELSEEGHRHRFTSKRVDQSPLDDDSPLSETTCHYLANAYSPFPLIVALDSASMMNELSLHNGGSCRVYYLWIYGVKFPLEHWYRYGAQVIYE